MNAMDWFYHNRQQMPEQLREIVTGLKPLPADIALLNHLEVVERLDQYNAMSVEEKFKGKTREQIQDFLYRYNSLCFRLTEILEGRG